MRRYEILLPLRFNDGAPVPKEKLVEVVVTVRKRFRAASAETQTIHGSWEHQGQVYQDDLVRVFADVPDTAANREWFLAFKEELKAKFQQIEIWMITHPIEII